MNNILIIDVMNLISAAMHVQWPKNKETKLLEIDPTDMRVLVSNVNTISQLVSTFRPAEVVLACDPPGGCPARKALLERYKMNRKRDPIADQHRRDVANGLRKVLPCIWAEIPGYEADDLMARIVEAHRKTFDAIITSNDRDLFQLSERFEGKVQVYDHIAKGFMQKDKMKHPGHPIEITKALLGDTSDNIPSVTGEVTFLKIMSGEINLNEYLDSGITKTEKLPRRQVFERNLQLVSLLDKRAVMPRPDLSHLPIGEDREFEAHEMSQHACELMPDAYADGRLTRAIRSWQAWYDERSIRINRKGVTTWVPGQTRKLAKVESC